MSPDNPLYGTIEPVRSTDAVAHRIEQLILDQRLAPGAALPAERELAAQFAVSRNVLREALRSLSQKGLIRVVHGRGAFVQEPTTEAVEESLSMLLQRRRVSLVDLCDARLLLEPEMAALAAARGSDDQRTALRAAMTALEAAAGDAEGHVEADLALHRQIAEMAGHSVYEAITEAVRAPVTRSMLLGTSVPRAIDASDDHHRAIVEAIASGDGDAARAAMREHIAYIRAYVEERDEAERSGR
jgi:GntR family transcriptional repressor for pyruvate dehydrogenase complex